MCLIIELDHEIQIFDQLLNECICLKAYYLTNYIIVVSQDFRFGSISNSIKIIFLSQLKLFDERIHLKMHKVLLIIILFKSLYSCPPTVKKCVPYNFPAKFHNYTILENKVSKPKISLCQLYRI